ncbi:hypothetical protein HOLleu_08262 [Holothuria leucospilota]|uniref:Uncharacterized protein n=1 Tax=Holothuria leucospilota TaxID=206669 RepID=A0A9Q1HG75_HOLLE|nr:hypothetical protein HOLleu_08262 [Holothuria leucospilota]
MFFLPSCVKILSVTFVEKDLAVLITFCQFDKIQFNIFKGLCHNFLLMKMESCCFLNSFRLLVCLAQNNM